MIWEEYTRRSAEWTSPDRGPEIGRNRGQIGRKSTPNGPNRGPNRAKSARFRGGLGPPDDRLSAENRRTRAERRLMGSRINDINEEGRSPGRPGPGLGRRGPSWPG